MGGSDVPLSDLFDDLHGRIQRGDDALCINDQAALETALAVVTEHGMAEVWMGIKRLFIVSTDPSRLRSWSMHPMVREGISTIAFA